ncbi:MAG TPA: hypothetical protein VLK65_02195 [Vicinamibacteria bacterium]|nr:hypothetical protein [Vicinamibacteria bacterium]
MEDEAVSARERRARARAKCSVLKYRLGEEPGDEQLAAMTPEDRVAMMWAIAVDAWILSGREIPEYDRDHIPARLFRPGEKVPEDDSDGS